ncbi:hypothetical protein AB0K43_29045 [Kitasatospora sp. NPDC049258]|uniref:hypothetical protein n=1 Tax=Kitasatospora sp. NPDC049258 TaxID=3155394 RepID=UPI003434E36E
MATPYLTRGGGLAAAAVLLAVGSLTACSGGSQQAGADGPAAASAEPLAPPPIGTVPILAADVASRALPIDPYLLDRDQRGQLDSAMRMVTERCMAGFGFGYHVPGGTDAGFAPATRTANRYLVSDPAFAAQYGYHAKVQPPAPPSGDAPTGAMAVALGGTADPSVKPGSKAATGGQNINGRTVPRGGCVGEALDRTGASEQNGNGGDDRLARDLDAQAWAASKADSRVLAAFRSWSDCMKAQGYAYGTPIDANADPQWTGGAVASAKERATATADAQCKVRANVVGIWFTVEAAYESKLIEQHAEALAAVKQDIDRRMRMAAQAIAS